MHSSSVFAVLFAGLALASPVVKKAEVINYVTVVDYEYVTIDADQAPAPSPVYYGHKSHAPKVTTTTPSPSSTSEPAPVLVVVPSTPTPQAESSSAAPAPPASSPTDLASSGVYYHNLHRQNHSAPDLTWSSSLADSAQVLAQGCEWKHDVSIGGGGYGQNLYEFMVSSGGPDLSPTKMVVDAIESWYGEASSYTNYYGQDQPPAKIAEQCGHLTQMIWVGSDTVGCAAQYCPDMNAGWQTWLVVCNYGPPGNYQGEYKKNVNPPLGKDPVYV